MLTEFQRQRRGLFRLCFRQHLDVDGYGGAGVGWEEGEKVPSGFAGAGVEGGEGCFDGGEVFGEHLCRRMGPRLRLWMDGWRCCLRQRGLSG